MERPLAQQKKDLSDLKARLGLKKEPGTAAPPAPFGLPAPGPQAGAQPPAPGRAPTGAQPPAGLRPQTGAQPPVGMRPPTGAQMPFGGQVPQGHHAQYPGMGTQPQPSAAPQQPAQQNPFAHAQSQLAMGHQTVQVIGNAGPELDIPQEKKRATGLVMGVGAAALVALVVGYGFGGVMHARKVYNLTVDDAKRIKGGVGDLAKVTKKVVDALGESRKRNAKKIVFDQELIDALRAIQQTSPLSKPETAAKLESQLFRTNYALMDDMLISRLFGYFNNSLRLLTTIDSFLNFAEGKKKTIDEFLAAAQKESRNYGLYLAADRNHYYIGGLAQISSPVCQNKKAWKPEANCQLGFLVSTEGQKWAWRPGKPDPKTKTKLSDIIVPVPPTDPVLNSLTGKPGQMDYARYMALYRSMTGIAALLTRDHKPLLQDLGKQANKPKVFSL